MWKILLNKKEITAHIGELTWSDSIDTLGVELNFNYLNDKKFNKLKLNVGDIIECKYQYASFFLGMITQKNNESAKAFDFLFWLNKSTTTIQFNKMLGDDAIKLLCNSFGLVAEVPKFKLVINKVYHQKNISEIIREIIQEEEKITQKKYKLIADIDKIKIEKIGEEIKPIYRNPFNFDVVKARGVESKTTSIEDMKNKITVVNSKGQVIKELEDNENIKKYGLLQHVEQNSNTDGALQIAINLLKEKNKISEKISINLLGSVEIKSGKVIRIEDSKYMIKSCNHTLSNNIYFTNAEIERL